VGSVKQPRLLLVARAGEGRAVSTPKPWITLEELPEASSVPPFAEAIQKHETVVANDGARLVFPVDIDNHCFSLLDMQCATPLPVGQVQLIRIVMEIYRNQIALLDYGEMDSLTGLLNRKTYDHHFNQAGPQPGDQPGDANGDNRRLTAHERWLAVIDIDHFKRVNDNYGHLIGDELLLLVARLMRSTFRFDDVLYRFGGEEFVVLVRAPRRDHACSAFERFRGILKAYDFPQAGRITASIGFTQIRSFDTPTDAFERADRAVYYAKQHGRDQVRCFEDLVEGGSLLAPERGGGVELF
jgi:diguanylate cyclase (GGDEF)-like protein